MRSWSRLFLVFVIGLIAGFGITKFCDEHRGPSHGADRTQWVIRKLDRKLRLTPEQREKITQILQTNRQKLDSLHEEVAPRYQAIRSEVDDRIRETLTPDQQTKYDKLRAEWEKRRSKRSNWTFNRP